MLLDYTPDILVEVYFYVRCEFVWTNQMLFYDSTL